VRTFLLLGLVLSGCGSDAVEPPTDVSGDGDDSELPAPAPGTGVQMEHRLMVGPGEEAWSCKVAPLPTDDTMFVNHVESVQNNATHHMDLMAVTLAAPDLEPGEYDCNQVYADYPALMEEGIIVYASQQAAQEIVLPQNTVAALPPATMLMHEIHFVNPTDEPVEVYSLINAYSYPAVDVTQTIWGGAVRDLDINIPAGSTSHVEWMRCVMDAPVDVLFLSTHTHALAEKTVVRSFDGSTTGAVVYENFDWHAPKLQDMTATPMHLEAGQGFELECHYDNPTGADVHWGFSAAEEMCQIALVYTPGDQPRECEIVEQGVR